MAAELVLERRDFEAIDVENVQLLALTDIQPDRLARDCRARRRATERLLEKCRRLLDFTARQRQMGQGHGEWSDGSRSACHQPQ